MTANLKKMKITAYSDNEFKEECGNFTVQINPDSFSHSVSVRWTAGGDEINKKNLNSSMPSFNPEKYSFTLYFDGTGVTASADGNTLDVKSAVDEFLSVVYRRSDVKEESGQFVYVELSWCGSVYKCVAESVNVSYTLFDASGKPLRAKLVCNFSSYQKPKEDEKKTPKTAPRPKVTGEKCVQPGYGETCNYFKADNIYALVIDNDSCTTVFPPPRNMCPEIE